MKERRFPNFAPSLTPCLLRTTSTSSLTTSTRTSPTTTPSPGETPGCGEEAEESPVIGLSESEISTSTSTATLNGASASDAYDYLRPLVPNVEASDVLDEQQALHMANPYVETPTFKFLQDGLELSNFELELERNTAGRRDGEQHRGASGD